MKFLRLTCGVLPGLLLATSLQAQDSEESGRDTIVVTATRSEIPLSDAIVPITVIGRQQIEQSLAFDLSELLRFEAGMDIGRNGGPGQSTSVFLRGTESNHTLVLMDGVRINPGTIGGAAIQNIAPEMIERVEIVKGARSALFGTDAIGGVINVITRRTDKSYVEGAVGGGSFDTRSANVSAGSNNHYGEYGATINWQSTDGYAIRTDSDIERGYENLTLNLNGRRDFAFGALALRHWQTSGTSEYLDFFLAPVDQDFTNSSTAIELGNDFGEHGNSRLIVSHIVDDIDQNQGDDFVRSKRFALDWQYSIGVEDHLLAAGIYLVDENAEALSFGSGFDEDTSVRALFVQDTWSRGRHQAFLAARLTDYKSYGNNVTWNVEYAIHLNEAWTLNAGIGHAFRAPDASDRFGFGGNPDLNAETADEVQLGVRYSFTDRQSLRLELYSNDIDDLIEFDFSDFTLRNIGTAEIRGAQLGYEYLGESFVLRADFLHQSAENAETGERLLRRADQSMTVSYTQDIGRHSIGLSVLASGDREDFATTLAGYVLANLTAQVRIGDRWQMNARIENILDTEYETASPYRMQERSAFVDLKYRWD